MKLFSVELLNSSKVHYSKHLEYPLNISKEHNVLKSELKKYKHHNKEEKAAISVVHLVIFSIART